MALSKLLASVVLLSSAVVAQAAAVSQKDFTGIGHIFVLNSSDWSKATPAQKVGCLDDDGRFINDEDVKECGVFARLNTYPYTLSSKNGNCTFDDEKTVANTDSVYGKSDHAWTCNATYTAVIYDELYTIDGFNYPFLCFGDIACYYDAKTVPTAGDRIPLWQFHWGSQQRGITPGHVQLQLLWDKIGELPKREGVKSIPSPRIEVTEGMQVPLTGHGVRS